MSYELHCGDALTVLRTLPAESVQTCVTSPPYYGLRDYGTATWQGGDPECEHSTGNQVNMTKDRGTNRDDVYSSGVRPGSDNSQCRKCGARRIDDQIGLEESPDLYVARLVDVFREVRRVLHPTGVVFLNLGDSYNGSGGYSPDSPSNQNGGSLSSRQDKGSGAKKQGLRNVNGLGPKQLLGIPWRTAFALQADGWILRSEIIWHKRAPMPESVTDRPTKAHEQVFLLSKAARYYYDAEAIAEDATTSLNSTTLARGSQGYAAASAGANGSPQRGNINGYGYTSEGKRNRRSVWTLGPESYSGAHFATMPTKLVEPCVLAGTSAHGCCAACGAPWGRVVERVSAPDDVYTGSRKPESINAIGNHKQGIGQKYQNWLNENPPQTTGWAATCTCNAAVVPQTVLDPFAGSGTTLAVALKHGRRGIGIELNAEYLELAHTRIRQSQPMLLSV